MTEDNGYHLFVPIAAKWLASGTDDDDDDDDDDDNDNDDDPDNVGIVKNEVWNVTVQSQTYNVR